MRVFVTFSLLICAISQWVHPEQKEIDMSKPPFTTHLEYSVSFVTTRIATQDGGMGTGFFYSVDLPPPVGPEKSSILLISNKHVFYEPKDVEGIKNVAELSMPPTDRITIALNKRQEDGSPIFGSATDKTFKVRNSPLYLEHPNPNIDLACLNVTQLNMPSIDGKLYMRSLSDKFLKAVDYGKVAPGSEVLFVGYPGNKYDVSNNLPLIRKGFLASIPYIDFGGNKELVIDAEAFPGSSGSPVFVSFGGKYTLLAQIIHHANIK